MDPVIASTTMSGAKIEEQGRSWGEQTVHGFVGHWECFTCKAVGSTKPQATNEVEAAKSASGLLGNHWDVEHRERRS